MALPKLSFIWGASRGSGTKATWRLGLWGTYERSSPGSRRPLRGLVISVRGLLLWGGALGLAGYLLAAAVLHQWLDRRPYNFVTYADLVLPTRWSQLRSLRGQAIIAEGRQDLRDKKWGEGIMKLRVGIERHPRETAGRLELAQLFLAMNARRQAVDMLRGGLEHGYPGRDYLEAVCRLAAQGEDFELWLLACDTALAQLDGRPERAADRKWVVQQKLNALIAAERGAEAVRLAEAEGETDSSMLSEFKVLGLLEAGQPAAAVAFLADWRTRYGANPQIVRLQVRAFREAGRPDDMDRALEELRAFTPSDPRPYVYAIVQRLLAGQRAVAEAALDSYIFRFGGQEKNYQLLAEPLAGIPEPVILQNLTGAARAHGFDSPALRVALAQAYLRTGQWGQVRTVLAEPAPRTARRTPQETQWIALMQSVAGAALDPTEAAQAALIDQVRKQRLQLRVFRDFITAMRKAGRPATARELVTFAEGLYIGNATLAAWRGELDAELAAAQAAKPETAPVKVDISAATPEMAAVKPRGVVGAEEFFQKLGKTVATGDFSAALQQIREIRLARPDWLETRDEELRRQEIRLNGRTGDLVGLQLAARLYLNGDRIRSARATELADELYAAGRPAEAIFLVKELLRKVPDYPPAKRQLAAWERQPVAP